MDAWVAGDGAAAAALFTADGTWDDVSAEQLPALHDWLRAVGAEYVSDGCRLRPAMGDAECTYSVENDLTQALDTGPIANSFVVESADGAISAVNDVPNERLDEVWQTFADWVADNHPDDVEHMFTEGHPLAVARCHLDRAVGAARPRVRRQHHCRDQLHKHHHRGGQLMNIAARALLAAGAVYAAVGVASDVAGTEPPGPPAGEAMNESTVAAPLAVTGRILCGPEVQHGTEERAVVPLADGEMTIDRARGFVWRQSTSSMSDPRLEGTVHQSADSDSYTLSGGEAGPSFEISTKRIENDEGAWQGSAQFLNFPDGTVVASPYVMVGEGAYEGLTAIYSVDIFDCGENIQGYIIEGNIPAVPDPYSGE